MNSELQRGRRAGKLDQARNEVDHGNRGDPPSLDARDEGTREIRLRVTGLDGKSHLPRVELEWAA